MKAKFQKLQGSTLAIQLDFRRSPERYRILQTFFHCTESRLKCMDRKKFSSKNLCPYKSYSVLKIFDSGFNKKFSKRSKLLSGQRFFDDIFLLSMHFSLYSMQYKKFAKFCNELGWGAQPKPNFGSQVSILAIFEI